MEATARLSSKCAACQAESEILVRQYIGTGGLEWSEVFTCECGHGFEAGEQGLPSPAAREALLAQHGSAELWLDEPGQRADTIEVLTGFLGVDEAEAEATLDSLPARLYQGTRVEARFMSDALEAVSAQVRVVARVPTSARVRRKTRHEEPAVSGEVVPAPPASEPRPRPVTKQNAAAHLRRAIGLMKTDADGGAALALAVFAAVRRWRAFGRYHASFEVLVHILVKKGQALDTALVVARELMVLQRDRTHLLLLAQVLRAMGRVPDAKRLEREAADAEEAHTEVERDFMNACAALGVDPTQP